MRTRTFCSSLALALMLALIACRPSLDRAPAPLGFEMPAVTDTPLDAVPDTASYTITATLSPDHTTVDGTAHVRWVNRSSVPATALWWHLYMNGFSRDDTLFMRSGGRDGHRGHAPGLGGSITVRTMQITGGAALPADATPTDPSEMHTVLPAPVAPGATLELDVAFTTVLPECFARTCHAGDFAFAGQWFPKLAVLEPDGSWTHFAFHYLSEFYADFGHYDVTLTVPPGDRVAATGRLASRANATWRFTADHVHDFAWSAWSKYGTVTRAVGGTKVTVFYPPGESGLASYELDLLAKAMPLFARRWGPYPYDTLTVVMPPRFAAGVEGMEYPTLITTMSQWPPAPALHDTAYLVLHEFAHQYFQGMMASNEHGAPVLDEGMAEYATGVVMDELFPEGGSLASLGSIHVDYFDWQGAMAAFSPDVGPLARGAESFADFNVYGTVVYRRGSALFHTIERVYGGEHLGRALRRYAATQRFRHPDVNALLDALRAELPADVVDGWIRTALTRDSSLDLSVTLGASKRVGGRVRTEVVVHRRGPLDIPVDVDMELEDGARLHETWPTTDAESVHGVEAAHAVVTVRIDSARKIALDRSVLDNAVTVRARATAVGVTTRASAWTAWLLRVVGP